MIQNKFSTQVRTYAISGLVALSPCLLACSDDGGDDPAGGVASAGSGAQDETSTLDPQVPVASKEGMAQWLAAYASEGWEAQWTCEATATDKTTDGSAAEIHVHGASNRVCNNTLLANAQLAAGAELPVGAAALKYVGADIYAEVKVAAASDGGNGWFWYAPGGAVAATGAADCTGCHAAAGSDAAHPGLGDYVYFQVN